MPSSRCMEWKCIIAVYILMFPRIYSLNISAEESFKGENRFIKYDYKIKVTHTSQA